MNGVDLPRIAVIGCGRWGNNIIRNFHDLGVLAAVVDTDEAAADRSAKRFDVPAYPGLRNLLDENPVEAVAIATPSQSHAELACQAFSAGLDVFVEKPMATHLADGLMMTTCAEDHDRLLMVGHLLEYHGAVRRLKQLIRSGELGKIEYIYANRLNLPPLRLEENALWSFAPHDISVILYLREMLPSQVVSTGCERGVGQFSDVNVTNMLFKDGLRAHVFVSWLHPFKEQRLVVSGSRGMAVFDDVRSEKKLLLYPARGDFIPGSPEILSSGGVAIDYDETEPLKVECQHFVECIQERKKPLSDARDGLRVLSVLQASQRSLRKGGAVTEVKTEQLLRRSTPQDNPVELDRTA